MSSFLRSVLGGKSSPRPSCSLPAPELREGETVYVRALTLGAAARISAMKDEGKTGIDIAREMFPMCVCDEDGTPLFEDGKELTAEQAKGVQAVPLSLVMRVVDAARTATEEEKKTAKKPSSSTAGSDSPTESASVVVSPSENLSSR